MKTKTCGEAQGAPAANDYTNSFGISAEEENLQGVGQFSAALEGAGQTVCSLGIEEACPNDKDLVGFLRTLDVEPDQSPSLTKLRSIAAWMIVEDQAVVEDALSSDMIQQMIARDGMTHGVESQGSTEEPEVKGYNRCGRIDSVNKSGGDAA